MVFFAGRLETDFLPFRVVGRPTLYPTEIASTTQFTSNDTIEEEERPESDDDQHQHLREEPPSSTESTSHPGKTTPINRTHTLFQFLLE